MGDVCSTKLLAAPWHPFREPGKVVQIDESLFVHTQKVRSYKSCHFS